MKNKTNIFLLFSLMILILYSLKKNLNRNKTKHKG